MLDTGLKTNQIEKLYFINKRIDAEEKALKSADIVVTSTKQESVYQYSQYCSFSLHKARVIPPGVDHNKFHHIVNFSCLGCGVNMVKFIMINTRRNNSSFVR